MACMKYRCGCSDTDTRAHNPTTHLQLPCVLCQQILDAASAQLLVTLRCRAGHGVLAVPDLSHNVLSHAVTAAAVAAASGTAAGAGCVGARGDRLVGWEGLETDEAVDKGGVAGGTGGGAGSVGGRGGVAGSGCLLAGDCSCGGGGGGGGSRGTGDRAADAWACKVRVQAYRAIHKSEPLWYQQLSKMQWSE